MNAWEAKKGGTRAGGEAHAKREGGLGAGERRSLTTWTQKRDHVLVELVRECVFDFEEVALRISVDETVADVTGTDGTAADKTAGADASFSGRETADCGGAGFSESVSGEKGGEPGRRFRVTAEECRLRFAWLDREEGGGDDSIGVGVGVGVGGSSSGGGGGAGARGGGGGGGDGGSRGIDGSSGGDDTNREFNKGAGELRLLRLGLASIHTIEKIIL